MLNTVKLKDVCEFKRGLTYSKKDEVDYSSNIVVRATNIDLKNNKLNLTQLKYIKESIKIDEDKILKKGDILICTASGSKSHLGKVALIYKDIKMAFGGFMAVLRTSEKCLPKFLYNILISQKFKKVLLSNTSGANINNLRFSQIENFEFILPSLQEQQRIVAKLDAAFADINNLKININKKIINSKKLYENFLTQIFLNGINIKKWPLEKLENYNEVVVGYVGPISKEYTTNNDDVLLLSTKNISSGEIDLNKLTRIKRSFHLKNKKSQLTIGDIIVARHGNSGEAAVVNHKIKEAHALNVIIIKKGNKILSEYISFLLNSGVLKKITESKSGSVQEIINTSIIKNLTIPIPSIEEQQTLIRKINLYSIMTKSLEELYKKKLIEIDALKNSILKKNLINRAA